MTPSVCPSKRLTATASSGPDGLAPSARDSTFGSTGRPNASAVTPAASVHATRADVSTPRTLAIDMAFITPSVRAATLAETTPAARPPARRLAASIVDATRADGADADAAENTDAADPTVTTKPRRASRLASIILAL